MGPSLQSLEDQYMLLTQQLSMILAACPTQTERDQVMTQYVASRRNYWNSIQSIVHDDDPQIVSLRTEMQTEQKRIEDCTKHLNNISKVIDTITEAVDVGTSLAAKFL